MFDINVPTPFGGATVRFGLPSASLLKFPPNELPETIPAPQVAEPTWKQPFNIPPTLYNEVLDVRVPITIACVYAVTVVCINRLNKSRGYKPYAFSHTWLFKLFVVLHNVFLAVYSAWTCVGMIQAFGNSLPDRDDPNGLVGVVDALCKINGPRGYGNAATYNPQTNQWSILNPAFKLTGGLPDQADVGRLWNQGLAYFGWIFYLSKFYEVVDTAIILAKGKRSSTLQTYHHAGAMMCMWAGIRFMAAPIWIFALVNSGFHAMMYTYYTLTALRIRVPSALKRSLTTMQITQFFFGTQMAAAYLFVIYTIPSPSSSEALKQVLESAPASTAEAGVGSWMKKMAFRAAGAEGIAENMGHAAQTAGPRSGYTHHMGTCLDTTGQGFAVWLNVAYLLPLTYLFVRFFIRSYLRRGGPGVKQHTHREAAEQAGKDALKGLSREIRRAAIEGETSEVTDEEIIKAHVQKLVEQNATSEAPRTRSAAASQVRGASTGPEEGFSPVSAKKGAKKLTRAAKESTPSGPQTKGQNPFGVLDRNA